MKSKLQKIIDEIEEAEDREKLYPRKKKSWWIKPWFGKQKIKRTNKEESWVGTQGGIDF